MLVSSSNVWLSLSNSYLKLLVNIIFHFRDEILSIIAVLSSESLFLCPLDKKSAANAARAKFLNTAGDHITLLKIYRCYNSVKMKKVIKSVPLNHFCSCMHVHMGLCISA